MTRDKSFRCPFCNKEFIYKSWGETENHKKECPYIYKDSEKRFRAIIEKNKKSKN